MAAEVIALLIAVLVPMGTVAITVKVLHEMRELDRSLDDLIELRAVGR